VSAAHEIYLAHEELIDRAIGFTCRRHHLYAADAQDFGSVARLHLLENDYAVLRAFQGRSSLQTYLVTVLTRLFLDWRNARWGKWRPSAEAKRMGPLAVRLETLVSRDGLSVDEAHETLRTNLGVAESRDVLASMAARFPRRSRRAFVSDDGLECQPAPNVRTDGPLLQQEAAGAASAATRVLTETIGRLSAQDRLLLRMRFEDDFAVADIARTLSLEAKPLYRRFATLLSDLRQSLEAAGVTAATAASVLEERGFDLLNSPTGTRETAGDVRPLYKDGRSAVQDARVP
jgi:RNA polymerase sigma factor for flagellar operon FliA